MLEESRLDKEFLSSIQKKEVDYEVIFQKLYQGVVETNKLIGIGLEDIDKEQRKKLIETYYQLRVEEGKEVQEAVENKDKENLVKELIDVLVVTGYEYYLQEEEIFECFVNEDSSLDIDLQTFIGSVSDYFSVTVTLSNVQDALTKIDCNLEKVVEEVLKSNLSKFPTLGELKHSLGWPPTDDIVFDEKVLSWQCKQIEHGGRYSGITAEKVVDYEGKESLCVTGVRKNTVNLNVNISNL